MRTEGTFDFSANYEVKIKGELDARKLVPTYADLLTFTANNYIPKGFTVAVAGEDNPEMRGIWMFIGDDTNLDEPASWIKITSAFDIDLSGFPDDNDFPDFEE